MKVDRTQTDRKARTFRRILWSVALVLGLSMALPFTGMLLTEGPGGQALAQQQGADEAALRAREEEQRREFWRQARGGVEGYTTVRAPEAGVLIQSGGEVWRSAREGPVKRWCGILLIGVVAAIVLFPFIVAFSTSLKEPADVFNYPPTLIPRTAATTTALEPTLAPSPTVNGPSTFAPAPTTTRGPRVG